MRYIFESKEKDMEIHDNFAIYYKSKKSDLEMESPEHVYSQQSSYKYEHSKGDISQISVSVGSSLETVPKSNRRSVKKSTVYMIIVVAVVLCFVSATVSGVVVYFSTNKGKGLDTNTETKTEEATDGRENTTLDDTFKTSTHSVTEFPTGSGMTTFAFSTSAGTSYKVPLEETTAKTVSLKEIVTTTDQLTSGATYNTVNYYGRSFIFGFMKNAKDQGYLRLMFACPGSTAIVMVSIPELNISEEWHTLVGGSLTLTYPAGPFFWKSGEIAQKSIHVTADRPVMLVSQSIAPGTSDGELVLPEMSLGTEYFISSYPSNNLYTEEFLIVGTVDKTSVTVRVNSSTETIKLNRLDSYWRAASNLSGTEVSSTAPVYVLSGHSCANIPDKSVLYCDYIAETMPPKQSLGTVHVVSFMNPRPDYTIGVIVTKNNTTLTIYDSAGNTVKSFGVLSSMATEFRSFRTYTTISVISSHPVLLTQYGHGSGKTGGDPSMMVIPDVSHFGFQYDFVVPDGFSRSNTIQIVISDKFLSSGLLLNGQSFAPTQTVSVSIPNNGDYKVLYGNLSAGYYHLNHAAGTGVTFGAWIYGYYDISEYAWSLGYT